LKNGGFDSDKIKLVMEVAATGENADKLPELLSLSKENAVEQTIVPINQKLMDETETYGERLAHAQQSLSLGTEGPNIWVIFETDRECPEAPPTMLDGRYTTKESAVTEMQRLSTADRDARFYIDILTPEQWAKENEAKPFGVFKVDSDDFRELMPERFMTEGEAEIYRTSLVGIEEKRQAECKEAEIEFTAYTFEIANLMDQDDETVNDTGNGVIDYKECPDCAHFDGTAACNISGDGLLPCFGAYRDDNNDGKCDDFLSKTENAGVDPAVEGSDQTVVVAITEEGVQALNADESAQTIEAAAAETVSAEKPYSEMSQEERGEFNVKMAARQKAGHVCPNCSSPDYTSNFVGTDSSRCNDCKKLFNPTWSEEEVDDPFVEDGVSD
jgi:hypothetical protein